MVLGGLLDISSEEIILFDVVVLFGGFEQLVGLIKMVYSFHGKHLLHTVKRLEFLNRFGLAF